MPSLRANRVVALALFLCIDHSARINAHVATDHVVQGRVKLAKGDDVNRKMAETSKKTLEDSLPVVEIRGEGKPMTAAQIRALEEEAAGAPLDIKIKKTWVPGKCPRAAKRKDFVTFQYKAFLEDGAKKFDQSYGKGAVRMQLGTGMTIPGIDKGLKGMCDTELRKIHVPWRLSRRKKRGKVWKAFPSEEHWLVFDIEMLKVEAWSPELQFHYMDKSNDSYLTATELTKHIDYLRKEFGKDWLNPEIDDVLAAKYFIKYFDADGDSKVSLKEYVEKIKSDEAAMRSVKKKPDGRLRDPGVAWILDFNNDGIITSEEIEKAPEIFEKGEIPSANETKQAKHLPRNEEL